MTAAALPVRRRLAEEEIAMAFDPKRTGLLVLRLIVGLALLGWPRVAAAGTWSVISAPGQVTMPTALAVDTAGHLYVVDGDYGSRIQKRDAQGNWSLTAPYGDGLGQADDPTALAVDTTGNLYVADSDSSAPRIQKRDARGRWSLVDTSDLGGPPFDYFFLAVDAADNLYVAHDGFQKLDSHGHWTVIATYGEELGQVAQIRGLAVDMIGDIYVAEGCPIVDCLPEQIRKRDLQGNWSVAAELGSNIGQVNSVSALAADTMGNLYVAERNYHDHAVHDRIEKLDAQGNWSELATAGLAIGQVNDPSGLAVDATGNLYVADYGNNRVQMYTPGP
jgi:DNA-binding beta-propeller fold protein YncE